MELKQKNKIISLLNQLYIYFYWSKINKRIGLCRVHLSCPCEGLWKTSSLVWFEYTWTCPCEGLLMTIDKYLVWLSLGAFELVRVSWGLLKTSIVWFGLGWVGCTWTCLCWGLWWPPPPPRWQTCRSSCQSSTEPPTVVLGHLRREWKKKGHENMGICSRVGQCFGKTCFVQHPKGLNNFNVFEQIRHILLALL